jgi:hypothetical protein
METAAAAYDFPKETFKRRPDGYLQEIAKELVTTHKLEDLKKER